jgi:type I restriction enzyme S subunit
VRIEEDGIKRISVRLSNEYSRTILKGGELLVNVRGTLGGVAVAEPRTAGWNVSREVAVVPVDLARVRPQFLAYMIAADSSQNWLTGVQKGAAYVGINIEDLREFPVFLPDLKTQDKVCDQIGEYRDLTLTLERNFADKLTALDGLRKSLLHQAYSGNL